MTEMDRTCGTNGACRGAYRVLVGKPDGRRPLGRRRRRLEDNIKMHLKKWDGGMEWIDLDQVKDRWRALVNTVMHFRVKQDAGNILSG
jgi:hypothetical protein